MQQNCTPGASTACAPALPIFQVGKSTSLPRGPRPVPQWRTPGKVAMGPQHRLTRGKRKLSLRPWTPQRRPRKCPSTT